MATIIIFSLVTILFVGSIIVAGLFASKIRQPDNGCIPKALLANGGVRTDERSIHHFVASGFLNESENI